jgi:hypothetical protein
VHHLAAASGNGAGGMTEENMANRLPDLRRRPMSEEQRQHLAEVAKIRSDAHEARVQRAAERAEAAAVAKMTETHRFFDDFERRQAQAAAEGRDRARVALPMDY